MCKCSVRLFCFRRQRTISAAKWTVLLLVCPVNYVLFASYLWHIPRRQVFFLVICPTLCPLQSLLPEFAWLCWSARACAPNSKDATSESLDPQSDLHAKDLILLRGIHLWHGSFPVMSSMHLINYSSSLALGQHRTLRRLHVLLLNKIFQFPDFSNFRIIHLDFLHQFFNVHITRLDLIHQCPCFWITHLDPLHPFVQLLRSRWSSTDLPAVPPRKRISKHSLFVSRSRSVVDCAHVQAFTFLLTKTLSRSRSVVWCVACVCVVCCGGVCVLCVLCVVLCVVLCYVCCVCCVLCCVVCVCVVCGEAWHTLSLSLLFSLLPLLFPFLFLSYLSFSPFFFFFFFSCSFSYSCSCSCSCSFSFSSFFFLLSSLLLTLLFSSLHANKHCTKHWSTNTASNFEAFECDVAHGTFMATANELHGMFPPLLLPPLLSSLLPPSHTQKKWGDFLLQEYFRRGNYFYYSFKLIPKKRRRVKLQSLQFYINSKTINLHHVKSVIIFAKMVSHRIR